MDDLHGKYFKDLPELWQDIILDNSISLTTIDNCDEEIAEKIFVQMNSGSKPPKKSEIRRAAVGLGVRKVFDEYLGADWLLHSMTPKTATGNGGYEVLGQFIALLHNKLEPMELSAKNIDNILYAYRESGILKTFIHQSMI